MTGQQFLSLVFQLILGGVGTLSFGVLFGIPKRDYLACAADGAVGWAVYELAVLLGVGGVSATLLAALPLTLLARIFAITLKAPTTVFLLCGIFPLVPGAGIYYTAYYFILGDNALCAENGFNTLKVAAALAIGISLMLSVPLPIGKKPKRR